MNKKFSTLLTAGLLIGGSLFSYVNAENIKGDALSKKIDEDKVLVFGTDLTYTLTSDCNLIDPETEEGTEVYDDGVLIINDKGATLDGNGYTFKGRIVVNAEGVTIKNLTLENVVSGYGYWQKNGITVFADEVTVANVNFAVPTLAKDLEENMYVGNDLVIFPKVGKPVLNISGNTFRADMKTTGGYTAAGIIVEVGAVSKKDGDPIEGDKKGAAITDEKFDLTTIAKQNSFKTCWLDYVLVEKAKYVVAKVTPFTYEENKKNVSTLDFMVSDLVSGAATDPTLIIDAKAADVEEIATENELIGNVALQCSDANVLLGEVEEPKNGKPSLIAGVPHLDEEVAGSTLYPYATSDYALLILKASDGKNWAFGTDKDGNLVSTSDITKETTRTDGYLWRMSSGKNADGKIWYRFESKVSKDGKPVKVLGEGAAAWNPVNNVAYNKYGVVFQKSGNKLDGSDARYFGLYKAGNNLLKAEELAWYEMDGFSVTIKYEDPKTGNFTKEDIAGNPFVGHLTPMIYHKDGDKKFHPATTETKFYLKDAEGNYIVAQKYASNGSQLDQSTYTFTTISANDMSHEIEKKEGKYFGEFHAEVSAKYTDMQKLSAIDVLCVMVKDKDYNDVEHTIGRLDLGTGEVPTLAASKDTELKPILVALGSNDIVNPQDLLKKGKFYTVEVIEGGVVKGFWSVAQEDEYDDDYEYNEELDTWEKSPVLKYGNVLEIQWALTVEFEGGKANRYVFTNREYKCRGIHSLQVNGLYKTAKADEYRYGDKILRIKPVAEHAATDGYVTLDDLKNTKFHIGFSSSVFNSNAWFTENHKGASNHTIGLDPDIENALEFTAIEYAAERKHDHHHAEGDAHDDTYTPTDSIYVISWLGYYNGNTYTVSPDTLKIVSYAFVNQYTEPLIYNGNENKLESRVYYDEDNKDRYETAVEAAKDAQKFAIRKDYDKYNLRLAYLYRGKIHEENGTLMYQDFDCNAWKLYAGDASKGLVAYTDLYNRTENDLFVVEPTEKPMYRRVVNPLDTVSIFRDSNEKSVLFESKSFLALENLAQYPEIAPAMLADTAYVRNDTYRPQYMLVVGPTVHPEGKWCETHQSATCEHAVPVAGWVEGRYLVNLVDSAFAWSKGDKHVKGNPYVNSEGYYRLGFVQATHRNDSLIVASDNKRLFLGDNEYNQAKFAFRYVDAEAGSFVIETSLDGTETPGYIKWMNGVVVVVDDIKNADIFNMNEDEHGNPTDNETIAASEVVVVAGEGQVTVANAAGKKVVISNILGQVVANTVLTSDNATVAAPQGVVVVAVEGEEAVKAIVK